MIILSSADVVLADRIVSPGSVVIDAGRIVEVQSRPLPPSPGVKHYDLRGHYVVPGFIDVHVHGIAGVDSLDGPHAVNSMAADLPRYGVTAFCPTSVACSPAALRRFLAAVREARLSPAAGSARVLSAHLESNFINPEYRGAQPIECLRVPPGDLSQSRSPKLGVRTPKAEVRRSAESEGRGTGGPYTGEDLLAEMTAGQADIGIVTLAPELPGSLELIRLLRERGHLVSLGHSAADYEQAREAISAGATRATHLFNRMPKIGHRHPGLTGAVLESEEVAAELVCDGYHVHPAMMRVAIAAKTPSRVMAITDGTAGAGLPAGSRVFLGEQAITVTDSAAFLDDGTLAGSVLTLDRAFRVLMTRVGLSPVDAAILCSTTPARELHMEGHGVIAGGAVADLAVLDSNCRVLQTWIAGNLAYSAAD